MREGAQNTFEEMSPFSWKIDSGRVQKQPKNQNKKTQKRGSPLCTHLHFPPRLPRGTYRLLVFPWEACLAVGCLCKCGVPGPILACIWALTDRSQNLHFHKFFMGAEGLMSPNFENDLSRQLSLAFIMSDETSVRQCSFRSALLFKNRLLVGQNRLSPCKWGVKGHNFIGSHLSLSQRHFRLVVCLHW